MTRSLLLNVCADRPDDHRLVVTPEGVLTVAQARTLGPAADLAADAVVLVSVSASLPLVQTLMALDGHVAGIVLVSTSAAQEVVETLAATAGATIVVSDRDDLPTALTPQSIFGPARADGDPEEAHAETVWMITTSGTTGIPKIVPHTLGSLSRSVRRDPFGQALTWGLVYEMTRFAGLQVALQSLIGGGTLVVAPRYAPMAEQIRFLASESVTHLSATPTLWRRLLMAPGLEALPLKQITMGGEIADQGVLDAVGARFPKARLTHIYASTEAGVGFAVNDRKAGFPLSYTDDAPHGVGVRIRDGLLWLRPPGTRVARYVGGQVLDTDDDGFVLTGDQLELTEDRAFFLGRDSGVVNIGGAKVYPERVEHTIAGVPGVGLVAVTARKNPIIGALLVATVVPATPEADRDDLKARILATCRESLEREAMPSRILFADTLETNAAGKISRT